MTPDVVAIAQVILEHRSLVLGFTLDGGFDWKAGCMCNWQAEVSSGADKDAAYRAYALHVAEILVAS